MPGMPIPPGEDNYRAFGSLMALPEGKVPAMVMSSDRMLPLKQSLEEYGTYGFDNLAVTRFLTVHEMGHSFVNPLLEDFEEEIQADSSLFIPEWKKELEPSYISSWETCLTEHLVRLGEIRVAKLMDDRAEEKRLREMHLHEFRFILLPFLEDKVAEYESNRDKYPDFRSFLPEIFAALHRLKPEDIRRMLFAQ